MNNEFEYRDNIKNGLTDKEVILRQQLERTNVSQSKITKSKKQILKDNIFTLFNLLNILIAIALAMVGAWSNILFIVIVLMNVLIGIFQEFHAKKLIDNLSLLMIPSTKVVRASKEIQIPIEEIVMDDIMILEAGQQISCDSVIVDGEIEANESLISGESDPIHKKNGDELLSGSSVISGKCYARVIHVGNENYASKIANEAKKLKKAHSELLSSMQKVTKVTSFMIIPLGIILFIEAFVLRNMPIDTSVISSAAGLLGMLPKGLVLLISVSLATGVSRLAKKKILVQDLYSLETLAHVDTLCLDKTGTITSGKMKVEKTFSFNLPKETDKYIGSFLYYSDDNNATNEALCKYFKNNDIHKPLKKIPFSSIRKWSAVEFDDFGTLIMGAPDRLLTEIPQEVIKEIEEDNRLIAIGRTHETICENESLPEIELLYIVALSDEIRENVKTTLEYFKKEGIDIKVISGDNVSTVSAIAKQAGLDTYDNYIDMTFVDTSDSNFDEIVDKYSVFGRVTPNQKKLLVQALKRRGHSVAMTGDGVNDILALKEADCSIAIAEGSDAAKQISQVVLLNSEFSCLPDVLLEGRRVVNNVTRVASVFFIKTIYSIIISLYCVILNKSFPFIPIQITLIDAVVEAFPAFLTIMEANTKPIKDKFLPIVFRKASSSAVAVIFSIITIMIIGDKFVISALQTTTMMYLALAIISMEAVIRSCLPMNTLRLIVCSGMVLGFIFAITIFNKLLHITMLNSGLALVTVLVILVGLIIRNIINHILCKKQPKELFIES